MGEVKIGDQFCRWTVIGTSPHIITTHKRWMCRCACGVEKSVRQVDLIHRSSKSCGCLLREKVKDRSTKHGLCNDPVYRVWGQIIQRCTNPKNRRYHDYGGRGITVCDRWLSSFEAFFEDMGPRPEGMSLDRIDNSRGYEPGNCRWATRKEQQRNGRHNRLVTHLGITQPVAAWADQVGLKAHTIRTRLSRGWPVELALTQSVGNYGRGTGA